VAVAALFYSQAAAIAADVRSLSSALALPAADLERQFLDYPNRGELTPMPRAELLIYRLYEIITVDGYAYKAGDQ
jgi:cyanate lyase